MTRDEITAFCQFLVKSQAINPQAVAQFLSDSSLRRAGDMSARDGAMAIVQHCMVQGLWKIAGNTMPERVADAWLRSSGRQPASQAGGPPSTKAMPARRPSPAGSQPVHAAGRAEDGYEPTQAMPGRGKQAAPQPAIEYAEAERLPEKIGPYVITGKLGKGGMGSVYSGMDKELGIEVAIKVISPETMPGPEEIERFKREARIAVALTSPYLVRIYTANFSTPKKKEGEGAQTCEPAYIAMERIRGQTLDKALAPRRPSGDLAHRIDMMVKVCEGVHVMHQHGVVHRDLKPGNIMVDETGRPVVLDLGLAKAVSSRESDRKTVKPSSQRLPQDADLQLTGTNVAVGTIMYMAPEQAYGENDKIGTSADVYALGKILFQILTGTHVHLGASAIAVLQQLDRPFPEDAEKIFGEKVRSRHDPGRLLGIIKKCMSLSSADRFPDAGSLAAELRSYANWLVTHEAEEARAREEAATNRQRKVVWAMGGFAALSVILGLVSVFFAKASREAKARAAVEQKLAAEERQRADAQAEAAQAAEARAQAETRASETARRAAQNSSEFLVCQSFMRSSRWSDAERRLAAMVERDGSYEPARYALAQVQYNLMNPDCLRQWEWLVEHGSSERKSEYLFYYIIHHEHLQSQDRALYAPFLDQMQDQRYRGIAAAWLKVYDSQVERQQGNDDRANALLAEAFRILPTLQEGDELLWLWEAMNGFLSWLEAAGKPEAEKTAKLLEARAYLDKAAARNTDFPMIQFWLGDVLKQLGDLASAATAFHRVEVLMPTWSPPKYMRRECYELMAQRENAAPELRLQIATETIAVCTPMLADSRMDARQAVMARITLLNAHIAAGDVYRARGDRESFSRSQQKVFETLTDLVQRPLAPEELLEMHIKRLTLVRSANAHALRHEVAENARVACEHLLARPHQPLGRQVRAKLLMMQAYLDSGAALVFLNRRPEAANDFVAARTIATELSGRREELVRQGALSESDAQLIDNTLRQTQPRQQK